MSTIVEELEQAAGISETLAKYLVETSAPDAAARALGVFAARLRQRAAWVRQAESNIAEMGITGPNTAGAAEMFRSLTGPIPAAETAPGERKEPA